jgi:hypothetical protein
MEVIHPRCAGLDVHKDTVVAAIRLATNAEPQTEVRTFSTATPGLLALSDWLSGDGCTRNGSDRGLLEAGLVSAAARIRA